MSLELTTVVSIKETDPSADHNSPLNVDGYGHDVFSSESEFPENLFIIECQCQTDVFCL